MGNRFVRALSITGFAGLFGVVDALAWGSESDVLFWIGNVSSTYLLVAFIAGRMWFRVDRSLMLATVAGMLATPVALATFYGWAIAKDGLYSSSVTAVVGKYLAGGLVTGPIFGFLGGLQVQKRSWLPAAPLGAAFALEPLAWLVHGSARPMPELVIFVELVVAAMVIGVFARTPGPNGPRDPATTD